MDDQQRAIYDLILLCPGLNCFLSFFPFFFFLNTWYNVRRDMVMRAYRKHNVAENMQVVEYRAEWKVTFLFMSLSPAFSPKTSSVSPIRVVKRGTLSWSVACFPAGRRSPWWSVGSFGIKSGDGEDGDSGRINQMWFRLFFLLQMIY